MSFLDISSASLPMDLEPEKEKGSLVTDCLAGLETQLEARMDMEGRTDIVMGETSHDTLGLSFESSDESFHGWPTISHVPRYKGEKFCFFLQIS